MRLTYFFYVFFNVFKMCLTPCSNDLLWIKKNHTDNWTPQNTYSSNTIANRSIFFVFNPYTQNT
ncbi:hypothetical protein Hanom_Chr14g01275141 [Helianthus anomalus]